METLTWYMILAAVLAGNALTAVTIYCFVQISKVERAGLDASHAKWRYLLGVILPCVIVGWAGWILTGR